MQAQSDVPGVVSGNHDDVEYDAFLQRVQARFVANISNGSKPLFTTDAEDLNQDLGKVETAVSNSELIRRYAPDTECHTCKNKVWAEGDIEYSPPGWGVYYCKPLDKDMTEEQAKHKGRLDGCPLVGA